MGLLLCFVLIVTIQNSHGSGVDVSFSNIMNNEKSASPFIINTQATKNIFCECKIMREEYDISKRRPSDGIILALAIR